MNFLHSLKPGVRYSSIFLLWWMDFLHRSHIQMALCVCTPLLCSASWSSSIPGSYGGLYSSHQTRAEISCARSPMPWKLLLMTLCAWKVSIPFSSVPIFSALLEDLGVNIILYPMSVILSHSLRSPLSADQEVSQGTSWNINEQPIFIL